MSSFRRYLFNNNEKMTSLNTKILIILGVLFLWPFGAQAATCEQNSILNFVVRDPGRAFIGGARVEVYKQEIDADGNTKPGAKVASATTDTNLGRARLSWRNALAETAMYAVRVQTITKDNASFWYYDYAISCGQEVNQEETLSGLNFVLRKSDGSPLTNTNFSVYSQLIDEGGALSSSKNELMASLNSGSAGSVKIYLPQGSVRSLGRNQTDYYVFEISRNNVRYNLYNLNVSDQQVKTVNFYLSRFRLQLKDSLERPAVGTKVEVYQQELDSANQQKKGSQVGSITIGNDGYGYLEMMPGTYVLGVKGEDNKYHYFWDVIIGNSQTSERRLNLPASFNSTSVCPTASDLNITLLTGAKTAAAKLKYEVYEQEVDASGLPVAGKKIGSGTSDSSGRGKINFKPNSYKSYLLKVWDKQESMGVYWFYDAAKFVCGYNRQITKTVPALKVTWRDSAGQLKTNFKFSLWEQQYDADNQPILSGTRSIGDFTTNSSGQVTIFVPPYNTYSPNQTGVYALVAKDASGNNITFYDIRPKEGSDTQYTAQLSGLSGQLKDARGRLQTGREIKLYQGEGGAALLKTKTDSQGRFSFEYPAGTYILSAQDDFKQESMFSNIVLKPKAPSQTLTLNLTSFSLSAVNSEKLSTGSTVRLYALAGSSSDGYVRDKEVASIRLENGVSPAKTLAAGPYLVTYVAADKQEYGVAFYATSGKVQQISLAASTKNLIKDGQVFRLSTPTTTTTNISSGSASTGLKGRILLQVEDKGQAWYVSPVDNKRYYLGRPQDAFDIMRRLGLGISNSDFSALQANPSAWKGKAGRIFIKTEDKGKAYYFDPVKLELHYLGRPQDAFAVMNRLGLGISDTNLAKIVSSR